MRSISSNLDNPCACLHIIISTTDQYGFRAVIRTLLAYPKLKSLYMKYSHCCDKIGASQLQVDQRKPAVISQKEIFGATEKIPFLNP